ncbi:MAG TPA: hypothetical protein VGG28_10180 [Kofleriaceae bacterium]|jgi:hypothetical protein
MQPTEPDAIGSHENVGSGGAGQWLVSAGGDVVHAANNTTTTNRMPISIARGVPR